MSYCIYVQSLFCILCFSNVENIPGSIGFAIGNANEKAEQKPSKWGGSDYIHHTIHQVPWSFCPLWDVTKEGPKRKRWKGLNIISSPGQTIKQKVSPKTPLLLQRNPRTKVLYNPQSSNRRDREIYNSPNWPQAPHGNPPVSLFSTQRWLLHLPGRCHRCPTHALPVCFLGWGFCYRT